MSSPATSSASWGQFQQMWSSPIWTPLAVIVPAFLIVGGGVISIYKYLKSRQHKEISYSIVNDVYLANIEDGVVGSTDIKVTVEGKKVQNVRFLALRIRNSGNVPIKEDDYEIPLWFMDGEMVRSRNLIDAKVYNTEPAGIPAIATLHADVDKAGINKLLLNSGDSIYINMLLSDYSEQIKVNGRIVGVKEIKLEPFIVKQPTNFGQKFGQFIAVLLIIGTLSLVPSISLFLFLGMSFLPVFIIIAITFSLFFILIYLFIKAKQKFHI